jgi:ATP-dependent RNA helicase DDX10/DBP4
MFERKNQNILSEHYNRMIDRSEEEVSQDENGLLDNDGDDDDFMTLKRTNHELPASLRDPEASAITQENMSKRKARLLKTKKGLVKLKGTLGKKLVFDDEGAAHDAYAMNDGDEFKAGGADLAVREAGRAFAEMERERLKEADVDDKQLAKAKKQEKKRKRKEREAAVRCALSPRSRQKLMKTMCRSVGKTLVDLSRTWHHVKMMTMVICRLTSTSPASPPMKGNPRSQRSANGKLA